MNTQVIDSRNKEDYEKYLHERYVYSELQKAKAEYLSDPEANLIDAKEVFARIRRRIAARGL